MAIVLGALLPNLALAAIPAEPQTCQSQAQATFKKKAVEVEMASIVGNMGTIEASTRREKLQRRLEVEQQNCLRLVHKSRAYAGDTSSHVL